MLCEPTPNERRLVGLCRRLLRLCESLRTDNDRLLESLSWLGDEYRKLKARLDKAEADHAAIEAAYDAIVGSVLDDEPLSGTPSAKR
jgi:hypothetical protein